MNLSASTKGLSPHCLAVIRLGLMLAFLCAPFTALIPSAHGEPAPLENVETLHAKPRHLGEAESRPLQNPAPAWRMAGLRIPWEELGAATSLPVDLARSPRFVRDARRDADSGSSRLDRNSGNVSAMATTGTLIVLPNINRNDGWDTWIQTQNVGDTATGVIVFLWGEYSAECPPNDCGPIEHFCQMIPAGSSWSLHTLLPTSVTVEQGACEGQSVRPSSAVVYSLATDTFTAACDAAEDVEGITIDWRQWEVDYPNAHPGEQLAVTVKRTGPGDANPGVSVASSYTGISEDMLGAPDPSYTYYAPLIYGAADNGFSSEIDIQNAGGECTVVWVYFMTQSCLVEHVAQVEALASGETYQCDAATYVGPGFEGSARIVAEQPLGIVVDQVGNDMLMSYNGVPAEGAGSKVSHAPLIYREYLGWDTDIAVQNLSSTVDAKVKVHFLDSSGDVISTVEDWICPQGATSFQLPAIDDLPGNYVGTARIESQDYDDGGSPVEGPQVHAVVSLVKYSGASPVEALAYNALPSQWVTGVGVVAFASLTKGGDGWTSEIAIQNANPSPGYTHFAILIYDETRLLDHVCERLNEGQVECVDLSAWDCIMPGFVGSVVISATHSTQAGGFALAAVGVERAGTTLGSDVPGDEVSCSEGFPLLDGFDPGLTPECPPALPTPSPSPPSAIGRRLVLPAIDDQDGWETRIEIQNVGDEATWAAIVYWGDPGPCPPNENGPLVTWDKQWLAQGGHWSPPPRHTARSAIVLSLAAEPTALPDETTPPTGEPVAVTVKRAGPGDTTPAVSVTSSYQGVSEDMLGVPDPSYAYHASGVYSNALNGLSSRIHMQNAGELCTPVWVYFRDENCMIVYAHHVEELAPGETYRLDASSVLAPGFVGSAWIAAELPLGIVVDQVGNDMLTTHNAIPAEGAGSQVNYVPLIYREYQGWETNITVYNLSRLSVPAKVKVYFLDDSGDIITTLVDWVCPGGSADFQLPAINDLPGSHVGAARVESQSYLSFGTPVPVEAPDIHSVVTLSKHSGSTPVQAMSYNALPSQWASGVGAVAFPSLTKAGGGWTSEIAIKNVNLNPGYTDLTIFVHDETGQLVDYVCARLKEKQVGYINLDKWWSIAPGFVGSMVISGTHTTQDGGFALAAVGVERLGATLDSDIPGDELSGSVGIPLLDGFQPGSTVECPTLASVVGVGGACDLSLDAEGHVKAVLPYTYTFGWGDGTESDAATAWDLTVTGTHVYSHCGADVTLLITDATGQTFSTEEFLRVNEPPSISSVPISQPDACADTIAYTASVSDCDGLDTLDWQLDFSDGGTVIGTGGTISDTYTLQDVTYCGEISATLTITDDHSCTDSIASNTVDINQPPTIGVVTIDQPNPCADVVTYTASISDCDGLDTLEWQLDFSDGGTVIGTGGIISDTYTLQDLAYCGDISATLTITDDQGCPVSQPSNTVDVSQPPEISSLLLDRPDPEGAVITYTATVSDCDGLGTLTWRVDFFDGGAVTGSGGTINGTYTMQDPSCCDITATLTITDDLGCTDTFSSTFHPYPLLEIAKSGPDDPVPATWFIRYSVVVTNIGTVPAVTVWLTDTLPAGTYYVNHPENQGWLHHSGVVTRTISSLPSGASATVKLLMGTRSGTRGVITNTVQARWGCIVVTATETTTIGRPPSPPTRTPTPTATNTPTPTGTPTPTASPSATPTPTPLGPQVTGSIAAYAWDDLNANGSPDSGEPPLAGAFMQLYAAGGSSASASHQLHYVNNDEPIASCTTGETGLCLFSGLAPGDYAVTITRPTGYWPTTDTSFEVTVTAGQVSTVHFGATAQNRCFLPLVIKNALSPAVLLLPLMK